ncbi:MAG: nucleoside-binding protein [Gammaproteobacteria bacterium]|nr:MAG: nucleoside-binding protein [Gammaproteobacteria bacterium]
MKCFLIVISVVTFITTSFNLAAKTLWSDYSVTVLRGNNYEVGDSNRYVATFEYATGTTWGDSFMFIDRLISDNGDKEIYGEFSPRFKLSSMKNSFFQNIYLATTVEMENFVADSGFSNSFTNYLVGIGTDLKIPHFNYFQINFYKRNNELDKSNYQTTLVWGIPIGALYYDGYLDYSTSTNNAKASLNFTSQLKYDISPALGLSSKLYVGVEYVFWQNKFGISGVDEKNLNLLIKYHF